MGETAHDVVGIGNAIVDIIARCDQSFLSSHGLNKGYMHLIEAEEADRLYAVMGPAVERSGGSAANTVAGLASFGGKAAFIGRVADDQFGKVFAHDIRSIGVTYATQPAVSGAPTALCLILVTPDGERTMNTFLGASTDLSPAEIQKETIAAAKITYLEGYLFDKPAAKEAFHMAAIIAREAGRQVALTLSDGFCVERHRTDFRALVRHASPVLFANEREIMALYQTESFDEAARMVRNECPMAVLTRSAKGSVIVTPEESIDVAVEPVASVVDLTGAGDLYAAGFLYGLTHDLPLAACGRLGSLAAAEVIAHIGARPEVPLKQLAQQRLAL